MGADLKAEAISHLEEVKLRGGDEELYCCNLSMLLLLSRSVRKV